MSSASIKAPSVIRSRSPRHSSPPASRCRSIADCRADVLAASAVATARSSPRLSRRPSIARSPSSVPRQIPVSDATEIPRGGRPDRDPLARIPVREVVETSLARQRPVADLVLLVSRRLESGAGAVVHRRLDRVVDRLDPPQPLLLGERGPRFEDQAVAREVLGLEGQHRVEIPFPVRHRGARNPEDQIEVDPADARRPEPTDRPRHRGGIVMPFERFQERRLETLASDAHPIGAARHQRFRDLLGDRLRIRLDRELLER